MFLCIAQNKEVQARASFCSVSGKGAAVKMCYRSLYIGTGENYSLTHLSAAGDASTSQCLLFFSTGADMDVCLTNYGHCYYVSGKHACIFYDEVYV